MMASASATLLNTALPASKLTPDALLRALNWVCVRLKLLTWMMSTPNDLRLVISVLRVAAEADTNGAKSAWLRLTCNRAEALGISIARPALTKVLAVLSDKGLPTEPVVPVRTTCEPAAKVLPAASKAKAWVSM